MDSTTPTGPYNINGSASLPRRRSSYRFDLHGGGTDHKPQSRIITSKESNEVRLIGLDSDVAYPIRKTRRDEEQAAFDEPVRYLLVAPHDVRLAGGGNAALLLAGTVYWTSAGSDGYPRSRPQPDINSPAWMNSGARHLAGELGLLARGVRSGEKQVTRALGKLLRSGSVGPLLELVDPAEIFEGNWRSGMRLTGEYQDAIANEASKFVIKVYLPLMSENSLPFNTALLLSYFYMRCVIRAQKLRILRHGHKWFAADVEQLTEETGLSADQVRTALNHLVSRELVITQNMLFNARHVRHFRIPHSTTALFKDLGQRLADEIGDQEPSMCGDESPSGKDRNSQRRGRKSQRGGTEFPVP